MGELVQGDIVEGNYSSPDFQLVNLLNPSHRATVLLERGPQRLVKPPIKPWNHWQATTGVGLKYPPQCVHIGAYFVLTPAGRQVRCLGSQERYFIMHECVCNNSMAFPLILLD